MNGTLATAPTIVPARIWSALAGAVLAILGLWGFLVDADPGPGLEGGAGQIAGLLATNDLSSALHLVLGVAGLALAGAGAAAFAAIGGVLLMGWALIGLVAAGGLGPGEIAGALPVDSASTLLHLGLGLSGIAAAVSSLPRGETARLGFGLGRGGSGGD